MIVADEAIAAALEAALQSPRFADRWQAANLSQGNCFVVALLVAEAAQTAGYPSAVVHGAPTLQRPPYAPYAHAWVEVPVTLMAGGPNETTITFAIDYSNGLRAVLPTFLYYAFGRIEQAQNLTYPFMEALALAVRHRHYGPYHNTDNLL